MCILMNKIYERRRGKMENFIEGGVRIKRIVVPPFDNNVYILIDQEIKKCMVIDAANDVERIMSEMEGCNLEIILQTHMHNDHTMALKGLSMKTGASIYVHPDEPFRGEYGNVIFLKDGMEIDMGLIKLKVLHTPGHTKGSVCFLMDKFLFCGDTIFPGGPGKTSSPSDFERIVKSIVEKLYVLPDETILLPGHGESITIGQSKLEYKAFASKKRDKIPWGDVLWLST
jgi:glyoxylase-like metal-dependent hydrolase (beta-lactamase superfamily II)